MLGHALSYSERAKQCQVNISKQLLSLLDEKKTNLCLSADVNFSDQLLDLANQLGQELCILKTHMDIIEDFSPSLPEKLMMLARKHRFLLFEDRKFADIGNTVKQQYQGGIYHIANWADLINAHSLPGPHCIEALAEVGLPKNRGLLLIAEMSSKKHLMDPAYQEKTLKLAERYARFVIGFICQGQLSKAPHWIYLTPGVQFIESGDSLGQQYITPTQAILEQRTDIIIVGRGILKAKDTLQEARRYRDAGWQAYRKRSANAFS